MQNRILELLNEQGYRPATFAKKVGVPQSTLAEILSGKRDFKNVGVSKIIAMAKGFGVTVEYLSGEEGAPKYPQDQASETLMTIFTSLNSVGQAKLIEYASDLLASHRYEKKEAENHSVSDYETAAIA